MSKPNLKIVPLPVGNLMDVPAMLRKLANGIEAGEYGQVDSVLSLIENEEGLAIFGHGEGNICLYNIGLLDWAKADMLEIVRNGEPA